MYSAMAVLHATSSDLYYLSLISCHSRIFITWTPNNNNNCLTNHPSKVQQGHSSTRSDRKHVQAPLAATVRSMGDLGAQPTASLNKLRVGCCWGKKTGDPKEKTPEQGREPTQIQPTYDAGSRNQTRATLVGGEHSHHCIIPAPQ